MNESSDSGFSSTEPWCPRTKLVGTVTIDNDVSPLNEKYANPTSDKGETQSILRT